MKLSTATEFANAVNSAKTESGFGQSAPVALWLLPSIAIGGYLWVQMISALISLF